MKKLLIILILVIPLTQSCDFFEKKDLFSNKRDSLLIYKKKQDSLRLMDSIQELKSKLSSLQRRNQQLLDSIREQPQRSSTGYRFHIIVGSFKTREYLNSYNRYVQEKGFDTQILRNEYDFHLISVESFNSWRQALNTLKQIRRNFEKTAWIYVER